ncbi:MAG TPA: LemA family protein [Longimicrobium sp.]|nr:LemA family protein [Longimicrobium sp.]
MRLANIAVAVALGASLSGCGYNRIQGLDEQVEQKRADVGVELTARNQLIPNLVEAVKGAAGFERGTFTDVARARSGQAIAQAEQGLSQSAQRLQQAVEAKDVGAMSTADAQVTRQIGTFINVAREAYPTLNATKSFQGLQDQLAESENRIAVARRDYNESVREHNTYIRQFPQAITARFSGAERKEPYREPAGSDQAPKVDFGGGAGATAP